MFSPCIVCTRKLEHSSRLKNMLATINLTLINFNYVNAQRQYLFNDLYVCTNLAAFCIIEIGNCTFKCDTLSSIPVFCFLIHQEPLQKVLLRYDGSDKQ